MQSMLVDSTFMPLGFTIFFVLVVVVAIGGLWAVLGSNRFANHGSGSAPERVPQLYGYTVCLITLMWGLTSVISIADNALWLSAPDLKENQYGFEPSVSSYEAFRF